MRTVGATLRRRALYRPNDFQMQQGNDGISKKNFRASFEDIGSAANAGPSVNHEHCKRRSRTVIRHLIALRPTDFTMTDVTPKTRNDLFAFLDGLEIKHSTKDHAPVFTVAESVALRDEIPGGHTKNLFVKDKKDQFFLLTVEENAAVDLKTVHTLIGASSKVSFGKPEKLMEYLGVVPGAVTAFGAINDTGGHVTFVLDADLMKDEIINCHPLSNDATTSIASSDLIRFMEATGHKPLVLKVTS
ncbi:Ala-tRNA(Pro) deacylase [Rhizobium sp. BK181]|nr:Ala-tRNA(Pro) deacylase [Rhizobium sp. BK181]